MQHGGKLYFENDINKECSIYVCKCEYGKYYIGKTCDFDKRCEQHFNGKGSQVTKKYKPYTITLICKVPGYFANIKENECTKKYIKQFGYENVRGGDYTNSTTLQYKRGEKKINRVFLKQYGSKIRTKKEVRRE